MADGKVLVAGGTDDSGTVASAEVYDPVSGTWTATGAMGTARYYHTATLLHDGKVLVAGGIGAGDSADDHVSVAELYDPVTGTWKPTGVMATDRWQAPGSVGTPTERPATTQGSPGHRLTQRKRRSRTAMPSIDGGSRPCGISVVC